MSARSWMYDTTAIHQSKLMNICLPASHDLATYALKDLISPQFAPWVQDCIKLLEDVANQLDAIPWLNSLINPVEWVMSDAYPAIRGLATATSQTIAQQLNQGIRCLDLRICYFAPEKQFYTYHGLLGSKMTDVLADIQAFLQSTSGEIVYITMGHWAGFDDNQKLYDQFSTLVENALGNWAYVRQMNGNTIANNPFEQTYQSIINQGGTAKSRVILVNGQSTSTMFWPITYSPPDNVPTDNPNAGSVIAGYYTNTTNVSEMTQAQKAQQDSAGNLPFALYMTLTPNGANYAAVVITSLSGALVMLGVAMLAVPVMGPYMAAAIEAVAAGLAIGKLAFSWRTLEELSAQVNDQLNGLMYDNFVTPGQPNNISFIYLDFYENTQVVSLAIALSLANAPSQVPQVPIVGVNEFMAGYDGYVRYQFTVQSSGGGSWTPQQKNVFRAYSKQSGTAVPVYACYQSVSGAGWNYMLSVGSVPSGWNLQGTAFFAFTSPSSGLMPIYQYTTSDPTFTTVYYYSPSSQASGWTRNPISSPTIAFYALPAPLIPIYAWRSQPPGMTRYNWATTNLGSPGWTPGSEVFRCSPVQQGAAVQIYSYYTPAQNGNFRLSTNPTPPAGFQLNRALCFAWPSAQPGLAAIREFTTTTDPQIGTIYMYAPARYVSGWTAGDIVFYAALPLTRPSEEGLNVLDMAALANPALA